MGSWVTGLLASIAGIVTMLSGGAVPQAPIDRPGTHVLTGRFVDPDGVPVSGELPGLRGMGLRGADQQRVRGRPGPAPGEQARRRDHRRARFSVSALPRPVLDRPR